MRKYSSYLLTAVMMFVLAGCSDYMNNNAGTGGSEVQPAKFSAPIIKGRLKVNGQDFVYANGTRFNWRFVTFFGGIDLVADGREAEADAALAWFAANGANGVRVLAMCDFLFQLSPQDGLKALPKFLELAKKHGLYVEIVALADTASFDGLDLAYHVNQVGQIAARYENTLIEIANEPEHESQTKELELKVASLRRQIPTDIPVALGIANEEYYFEENGREHADYVTVHPDRKVVSEGDWRWVRHIKETGYDIGASIFGHELPVVADEPIGAAEEEIPGKRSNMPEKFYAMALVGRITGSAGVTFHYENGLRYGIPTGKQLDCFRAWVKGITAIPEQLSMTFYNTGWSGGPVDSFDWTMEPTNNTVLRMYSAVAGDEAWSIAVRIIGNPKIEIASGWGRVSIDKTYEQAQLMYFKRGSTGPETNNPRPITNKLLPGQKLLPGEGLKSENGLHALTFQDDANFVLYNNDKPVWASNTFGDPNDLVMQHDGNFVLYVQGGVPIWASQTSNSESEGAYLELRDDGNLVVVNPAGKVIWTATHVN